MAVVLVTQAVADYKKIVLLLKFQIMKTRMIILLLVVSAVVTLSFTVVSVNGEKKVQSETSEQNAPVGGFVAEDKL